MKELFVNVLLYAPPVIAAAVCYLKERKKQAGQHNKNEILLFLLPLVILTGGMAVWSLVLMGLLSLAG